MRSLSRLSDTLTSTTATTTTRRHMSMFAVTASSSALTAVRGKASAVKQHQGRPAPVRASASADDSANLPRRTFSARVLGAAALSLAVNVGVGAEAARAFGNGIPGYDIDQAARQRALDAIKRCASSASGVVVVLAGGGGSGAAAHPSPPNSEKFFSHRTTLNKNTHLYFYRFCQLVGSNLLELLTSVPSRKLLPLSLHRPNAPTLVQRKRGAARDRETIQGGQEGGVGGCGCCGGGGGGCCSRGRFTGGGGSGSRVMRCG